jgi:hypothetical protein
VREISLPVNKPGVLLGGIPKVTFQRAKAVFELGVYIDGLIHQLIITFSGVYTFRFVEEDHIDVSEFIYGLAEIEDSSWIESLALRWTRVHKDNLSRVFGGGIEKVHHYRIVFLEHGMYELICKSLTMEVLPPKGET